MSRKNKGLNAATGHIFFSSPRIKLRRTDNSHICFSLREGGCGANLIFADEEELDAFIELRHPEVSVSKLDLGLTVIRLEGMCIDLAFSEESLMRIRQEARKQLSNLKGREAHQFRGGMRLPPEN